MKMFYYILFCCLITTVSISYSQEESAKLTHKAIFKAFEQGITYGDISSFSEYFGKQVYLNLKGAETGLFSGNQAYYILQNYFSNKKMISFHFSSFGYAEEIPFAVGNLVFKYKGNHIFTQVYISLIFSDGKWLIDKINFY